MSIYLEHQAMRTAMADVAAASARLAEGKAAADARVSGFLGTGWQGVAADSFRDAWGDWTVAAGQVKDGLDAMAALLDAAHRDMIAQDEQSQADLDRLAARIVDRLG
jgi:WXG100 family type VII secretion target